MLFSVSRFEYGTAVDDRRIRRVAWDTAGRETVASLRPTEGIWPHEEPTGNGRHLRPETGAFGETSAR